jgi:CO/xanthine dehydrogenase FAD-binding subunit
MKAPPFSYEKPRTLGEAFELLERHGDAARLLAGGQSLMVMMNMRVAAPAVLIDLNGLEGLAEISVAEGVLSIGAMVRQSPLGARVARMPFTPQRILEALKKV